MQDRRLCPIAPQFPQMRDFFGGGGNCSRNDGDGGGESSGGTEHSRGTCGLGQTRSLLSSEQYSLILS